MDSDDRPEPLAHVVLVGLPGAGKTSVGRRLAKELERPFADLDEQVELAAGCSVTKLFRTRGEAAFRKLETEVLTRLLGRPHPLVVAAGGGAVTRAENRALLGQAHVVWLRGSAAFLAARTDATHRPLLVDDTEATFRRLEAERTPLYAQVADEVVDIEPFHALDEQPKRALASHIADRLRAGVA